MILLGLIKQKTASGTYVIKKEKVWDEEHQKYIFKRKSIGKLDPDTGEIIPANGKKGRKPKLNYEVNANELKKLSTLYNRSEERVAVLRNYIKELKKEIAEQASQIQELTEQNKRLQKTIGVISSAVSFS